jgi:general secretion pathway protein J
MTFDMIENDSSGEEGFTLIEVLASLALFSLLIVAVFEGSRMGLEVWRTGAPRIARLEQTIVVKDQLRKIIGDAYPLYRENDDGRLIEFEGAKQKLTFLGHGPAVLADGARYRISVELAHLSSQKDLIVSMGPELAANGQNRLEKSILVENVENFELAYFGSTPSEGKDVWQETWPRRNEMPKLIRLKVDFKSGDQRSWDELLISPRIVADVACVYDQISKRCRGR